MRSLFPVLLLLLPAGLLHAQQQEQKLIDRILKPDTTLASSFQNQTYYAGGAASGLDISKGASIKDFYFVQKFSPKTFSTKEFSTQNYWQGDFLFPTKAAPVKADSDSSKLFPTKSSPVKDARESSKSYDTTTYPTRQADERGKTSQAHLEETQKGNPEPQLNMDQVRELLNKNK